MKHGQCARCVELAAELNAVNQHLDAAYDAAGLSKSSSKPLAHHILQLLSHHAQRGLNPKAMAALKNYIQADADGVMVYVSRQALDEAIAALTPLAEGEG